MLERNSFQLFYTQQAYMYLTEELFLCNVLWISSSLSNRLQVCFGFYGKMFYAQPICMCVQICLFNMHNTENVSLFVADIILFITFA